MVEHVVQVRHLSLLVCDDRKLEVAARYFVDILDPSAVAVEVVRRETDQLDAALGELWLELCKCS